MNELYGEKKRRGSRRWIYLTLALIVLAVFVLLPKPATVRLALLVAPDHSVEMVLALPKGCRLVKVYLRGNEHVPKKGKLFTLDINNHKFEIADFADQVEVEANIEPGYENRHAAIDWNLMKGDKVLTVFCSDVNKDIQRNDLELVFEVAGDPEVVKNWNKIVQLYPRTAQPSAK